MPAGEDQEDADANDHNRHDQGSNEDRLHQPTTGKTAANDA